MRCRGVLVFLVGCKAATSPAAECRERASHRYDPGVVAVAEGSPLVVRTIRCEGGLGDRDAACTDDAPAALRFTVTTRQGPPRCAAWDMRSNCWWGNEPGSSHGNSPGTIDAAGTYTFSGLSGGSTTIIAHVGVARASAKVGVRLVLIENPGHVANEVMAPLRAAADAPATVRLTAPPDGSTWRTDQGDGKPVRVPVIDIEGRVTAARVHIENLSRSITYDGYFAGSPLTLSSATWGALAQSTAQEDPLVVRVHTMSGGIIAASPEQRWRVDHGNFYHSPEDVAHDEAERARSKDEREAFERTWIATHAYISRDEAIARAVRYLQDQGFTNAPPVGPLRRDIVEGETEPEVRASRRGSIDPTPVGTLKKAASWWVAFRSVRGDPCHVRVVAVAADGTRQRMLHQDLSLTSFE